MTEVSNREAIRQALIEEMERDESVFFYGEDVAEYGGVYDVSKGLKDRFGNERVFDSPLSETALCGTAAGAAAVGARPVIEIMFADFMSVGYDHIIHYAAKMHFNYSDDTSIPLVIRTAYGDGGKYSLHNGQSTESWFQNIPGLKVVMPSGPAEYKGLLKSAIRDDDPVIFMEHKMQYDHTGTIPEGEDTLPLCESKVLREGEDITIVAIGGTVEQVQKIAEQKAETGISCEIINPRTIVPLDIDPILSSAEKTGSLLTVHEAPKFGGIGGEIVAQAHERIAGSPPRVKRIGAKYTPIPLAEELTKVYLPQDEDIDEGIDSLIA